MHICIKVSVCFSKKKKSWSLEQKEPLEKECVIFIPFPSALHPKHICAQQLDLWTPPVGSV